jgi:hypothetical protein
MATIISTMATREGFVIGSDGRKIDSAHTVVSDEVQKVFSVARSHVCLAYGLASAAELGQKGAIVFDYVSETAEALARVAEHPPDAWWRFLMLVNDDLAAAANRVARPQNIVPCETFLYIGGYFGGQLMTGMLHFRHHQEGTKGTPYPDFPGSPARTFGSEKIFTAIRKKDSRLAKYHEPVREDVRTLKDAARRIQNDVLAHFDPEARKIDGSEYWPYGGRIQIGSVTRASGFQWVMGFEPARAERGE